MSVLTRILFAIALALPLPALAAADRVALVIGMENYEHVEPLDNPLRDARAVAETLEGIGFKVTEVVDAPLQPLIRTLEDFAFRSETADLALIYFAGHGIQVQGENFLLPVDVQPRNNDDLRRQAVSLDSLLAVVDRARKMRIVILDACRNNPFGGGISLAESVEQVDAAAGARGLVMAGGGLAASEPDRGTLVSYAAKDGSVALDGVGGNSPFAQALIETLPQPGLEISLMFRQVRDKVLAATGNRQEPYSYGSLSGVPFYLAGPSEGQETLPVDDLVAAWSSLPKEREPELVALAETGDTRSMVALAARRLNRGGDFRPADAVSWYSRAADAGDPQAQFELARLYEEGILVQSDPARAKVLYMASADQEYADALNDVGFFYFHGMLGFDPDVSKALEYFERAANQRHPKAQHNFAVLIDRGQVPGKGPEDAADYLYAALRAGVTEVLVTLQEKPELFTRETRAALQRRLQEREFYSGAIDGSFGPGTNRGLRRAYGLDE